MMPLAFALVLTSAFMHAAWNLLAKRVGGGMAVVWLFSTIAAVIYLPLTMVILIIGQPTLGLREFAFLGGTCALHLVYYFLLLRGYSVGDMSVVYPLARGTGPMLSVLGAVLLLGERPSPLVLVGALLVSVGVFIIAGSPSTVSGRKQTAAIVYGLLTGLSIAAYTLWDSQAVSLLLIPPVFLTWIGNASQAVALLPIARRYGDEVRRAWTHHRHAVIGIGILDSLSYILFLVALQFGSVSLLTPVRQFSIVIGAFLGARVLSEGGSRRRLVAAGVMLTGLIALVLS